MNIEYWIELDDGCDTDHYPKYKYKHNSCNGIVEKAYHFCPHCAKKITHIDIIEDDLIEIKIKIFVSEGFNILRIVRGKDDY